MKWLPKLFGVALGLSIVGLLAGSCASGGSADDGAVGGAGGAGGSTPIGGGNGGASGAVGAAGSASMAGSAGMAGAGGESASGSAGSDDDPSCSDPIDLEGCACPSSSAPRSCYTGKASQAGIGSCAMGTQACVAGGDEFAGKWGACTGSGIPATCDATHCGATEDGCGGLLDCGTCPTSETSEPCVPTATCVDRNCGTDSDGCGGIVDCGTCPPGQICGGAVGQFGGIPGQCGWCTTSCQAFGAACGWVSLCDGGSIECGMGTGDTGCPYGQQCVFTDMLSQRSRCE